MSDPAPDLTVPGTVITPEDGQQLGFFDDDGDYTGVVGFGHYSEDGGDTP